MQLQWATGWGCVLIVLRAGSQIEAWMSNETLDSCKNQSLSGGAVPQDQGRLFCE